MKKEKMMFNAIQWLSALAMIGIVAYGFWVPISIVQSLVYNPLLLIGLLGLMSFVNSHLQNLKETASVYPFTNNNTLCLATMCKAA